MKYLNKYSNISVLKQTNPKPNPKEAKRGHALNHSLGHLSLFTRLSMVTISSLSCLYPSQCNVCLIPGWILRTDLNYYGNKRQDGKRVRSARSRNKVRVDQCALQTLSFHPQKSMSLTQRPRVSFKESFHPQTRSQSENTHAGALVSGPSIKMSQR